MRISEELITITLVYLQYRNSFNFGKQKFIIWKNIISYITGITDLKILRIIFYKLINKKIFKKIKVSKSTYYIYNPNNRNQTRANLEVTFD
tara:strand:+ start:4047 stop:4319 length:273 start_codon:yes stop_codon:yes gene_type:complete